MRRIIVTLLAVSLLLSGCGAKTAQSAEQDTQYSLYFLRQDLEDAGGGDAVGCEPSVLSREDEQDVSAQAEILMNELLAGPSDGSLCSPIPNGTKLMSLSVVGSRAVVDLSGNYAALSGISLTLADYCITLTLTQLPEVRTACVTVRGQELAYRAQQVFRARDVLLSSADDVVSTVTAMLYFADAEGRLQEEERELKLYEGDTQAEVLVEALQQGPEEKELSSALPEGFSVQAVWVDDEACYVNLPSAALDHYPEGTDLSSALTALSRSLCSLESVREVRILVDGERSDRYGDTLIPSALTAVEN